MGFSGSPHRIQPRQWPYLALSVLLVATQRNVRAEDAPVFSVLPGSTQKICQLTGEYDYHEAAEAGVAPEEMPTSNRTYANYGIHGTDLGASFEHDGKLWFLFGDTFATETIPGDPDDGQANSDPNPIAADATAFSTDADPTDGISLEFLTDPNDPNVWLCPSFDPGGEVVQHEGFSNGTSLYVWYATGGDAHISTLARSDNHGESFTILHDVSGNRFSWVSVDLVPNLVIPGLEEVGETDWLFIFGTGPGYRESDMFLAVVPLALIEDPLAVVYFVGVDENDQPHWSESENEAEPIIDVDNPLGTGDWWGGVVIEDKIDAEGCIGEFSVHYSEVAEVWIAMYNCEFLSIDMHTADFPWGPWSEAVTVFDPVEDGGYCGFLHLSDDFEETLDLDCEYNVTVPGRSDPGSPYGPYIMERYTTGNRDHAVLYFVMSMWHPYNVLVMTTEVARESVGSTGIGRKSIETPCLRLVSASPCHGRAELSLTIPMAQRVEFSILDVMARRVRTLGDRLLLEGENQIEWDGLDDGGRPVPGGSYICSAKLGREKFYRRIIMLRQ